MIDEASVYEKSLRLLARRDHSRKQMFDKLIQQGLMEEHVVAVLDRLLEEKKLDDNRFAMNYLQQRKDLGFGPLHIQAHLHQVGIAPTIIEACLSQIDDLSWESSLLDLFQKHFGNQAISRQEQAKCYRFFQQRGFSWEHIQSLAKHHPWLDVVEP